MTDEVSTVDNPNDAPIKTGADLEIEKLRKELTDLRARFDTELSEAQKANRELWAELHPVQPEVSSIQTVEDVNPNAESEAAFKKTLGIE